MPHDRPTLHLLCGKIASGKSSLCARLGAKDGTITIAEDAWLAALYADQLTSLQDYVRCAARLRATLGPHIAALLGEGLSVVLDFQANTVEARAWMRGLIDQSGADHILHLLDVPNAVCLARLSARNASGTHPFQVSEDQFHQVTRHFAPPTPDEGFTVRRYGADGSPIA